MTATNPPLDWQRLNEENGSLRAIIAELLITNQELRWALLRHRRGPVQTPWSCCSAESGS